MPRFFIHLAYRGTNYNGWQAQPNGVTVQEELNTALSTVLRTQIETMGCGRTDTGVHASSFYAHFDCETPFERDWLIFKLNQLLSPDIAIYDITEVEVGAHVRFDATLRTYKYYIHTKKDPFLQDISWYTHFQLDLDVMSEASDILLKTSDFASFCKGGSEHKTTKCRLAACRWERDEHRITFTISADRFLRNMVRSIVGTSVDLGRGKITLEAFNEIVQLKDRSRAGTSAPAHGLFLSAVNYSFL